MNDEALQILRRLEAMAIAERERSMLGHRIVFDINTGSSLNIPGLSIDPKLLDENGYQVRGAE